MASIDSLFDWLVDGAPGATGSPDVVARVGRDLRAAGVPVDRLAAFVSTLHPSVGGRGFIWSPDEPVEVLEIPYAVLASDMFAKNPLAIVAQTKQEIRRPIASPECPRDYPVLEDFAKQGFTDYVALPMVFTTGEGHSITFATKAAGGFTAEHVAALRRVLRPLVRLAEILALRRTASNLLSTYVGRNSGDRILSGRIQRGDIETIRAVIWFSDLRGFTQMSSERTPREIIDVINGVFECQVPAIQQRGGEVLKFIGDGMLAIFPIVGDEDAARLADQAIDAAEEAQAELRRRNEERGTAYRFGLALHLGEVAYGNIGSASRLDFTAIGPAVNLAARIEGLSGKLGRELVVSSAIAHLSSRAMEGLGAFELKGVPGTVPVFAPRARSES